MVSSSQSSVAGGGPLSLPLSKLSYSIAPTLKSKILWTHLPAQHDMFAVFDSVRQAVLGGIMERRILKVVHGGDVLDEIDLRILEHQAANAKILEGQESQSSQGTYPSIALIINKPLIALRYELPDGQIRRLQFKFKEDLAYDAAVQVFESLGLPINDKNPTNSVVPILPQSSSQPLNTILSSTESQDCRSALRGSIPAALAMNLPTGPDLIPRATTLCGDEIQPASSAPETSSIRPFTAPGSLSQMLPPKRILPFPIKSTKPSVHTSETSSSLLIEPSPELAQSPVATATIRKPRAKKTKPLILPPKAGAKQTIEARDSIRTYKSTSTLPCTEAACISSAPEKSLNASEPESSSAHPLETPTTTQPNAAAKETQPASLPKLATATPQVCDDIKPAEFIARLDQWVREHQPLAVPQPRQTNLDDLAAYAAQSKEDRMIVIDDMLCECLGDKNFLKLLEDVDQSWRRIGLGL